MRHSSQPEAGNRTFLMSQNRTLLKSSDTQFVDNLYYVKSYGRACRSPCFPLVCVNLFPFVAEICFLEVGERKFPTFLSLFDLFHNIGASQQKFSFFVGLLALSEKSQLFRPASEASDMSRKSLKDWRIGDVRLKTIQRMQAAAVSGPLLHRVVQSRDVESGRSFGQFRFCS
jgi:hypothetical protein